MYSGVVGRTQIYLGDEELELLDRVGKATGASRSELVRRAVRRVYRTELTLDERLAILDRTAGVWADRPFTGAEYVDAIRGDLNERLRRLGFD
jgi:Arc/MetJ-type ribon-helix-helix transcriptional regulator